MRYSVLNLKFISLAILISLLVGCGTSPSCSNVSNGENIQPSTANDISQVGLYSSVANTATPAQQDPLMAISEFNFGPHVRTVREAVEQVLQDTGYVLAEDYELEYQVKEVLRKPLPITQRQLGPISVINALKTLMDQRVFNLNINPIDRSVSFKLKPAFKTSVKG